MNNLIAIGIIVGSLILGIILGLIFSRIFIWKSLRKQIKNAREIIEGKRKNELKIKGEVFDATKFRVTNDKGKEILINLKGGKTEYAKEKNNKKRQEGSKMVSHSGDTREDSRRSREKKRDIRGTRRIRRFG